MAELNLDTQQSEKIIDIIEKYTRAVLNEMPQTLNIKHEREQLAGIVTELEEYMSDLAEDYHSQTDVDYTSWAE